MDEFHTRLRFNRRGLVGMANSGRKNDNGSQFFLTLGDTKELTGRNTMFGKIVGDTLYNLVRMGQGECEEGTERPVYPVKILGAEVVINPFEDMVPREIVKKTDTLEDAELAARKNAAAKKKKGGKALLSFGGEEGDEPAIPTSKKPKFNTRLVVAAPLVRQTNTPTAQKPKTTSVPKPPTAEPTPIDIDTLPDASPPPPKKSHPTRSSRSPSTSPEPPAKSSALAKTNAQIAALQASLRSRSTTATAAPTPKPPKRSLLSLQKAMLPSTSVVGRKRKRGKARATDDDDDDDSAAAALLRFQGKLSSAVYLPVPDAPEPGELAAPKGTGNILDDDPEGNLCDLHFVPACASCGLYDRTERSQSPELGDGLWAHTLSFEKDRRGKDLTWKKKNEELSVVDPREKEKEILGARKERRKDDGRSAFRKGFGGAGGGAGGSGGREWDRRRDEVGPSGSGGGSGSSGRGGRR